MPSQKVVIHHPVGLHARPASTFVRLASSFPCSVTIKNLTHEHKTANAKSILSVLALGAGAEHEVLIETQGDQENEALKALIALINDNFGEKTA